LATPAFQTPYTFLIPNKTSNAVAAVTVVLSPGSDDRPTVSARRRFSGSDAEGLKLKHQKSEIHVASSSLGAR
jgi:hypothetical protein